VLDDAALQSQLQQGFQDGLNSGFAQGMEEGKEEGYQEGLRLGFEEGVRKGRSEGKTQARQQFLEAAHPLDSIIASMETFMANYEQRRREELLQLVEKVTRQVIRCELALHPTQILTLVEEALAALPQQPEQVKVMLNSEEHRRISEAEPEKVAHVGAHRRPGPAARRVPGDHQYHRNGRGLPAPSRPVHGRPEGEPAAGIAR